MRKIVFFILCFAISMTAMLISVSAATGYGYFGTVADPIEEIDQKHIFGDEEHGKGIHHDGWYESKNGGANNTGFARVKLQYTKNGDTYTVTYPSYYVMKNSSTLVWDFAAVETALGLPTNSLNVGNIVAIELPYGLTDIPALAFALPDAFDPTVTTEHPRGHVKTPNTTLEYVFISDSVLEIGDFAFAHCTSLSLADSNVSEEGAAGLHNHQIVQGVGYRAFHHCVNLKSFNFNNHLTYLGEGAFQGCSLETIDLSKCVELRVVPAYCFHEHSIEGQDSNVKAIVLSNSIEEIGDYAFTGASAQHVFLGTGLKKIGKGAISLVDADYIILPKTIESVVKDSITFGNNSYTVIVVGATTAEEIGKLMDVFDKAELNLKHGDKDDKILKNSQNFFKDGSFCIEYLGGHVIDHNSPNITSVSYPNGIDHKGQALGSCGVCLQPVDMQIDLTPIIVTKGYSICEYNGVPAFTNGFEVYHDALAVYERVYGECEIGILFLLEAKYTVGCDLRRDIAGMGICLDEATLLAGTNMDTYSSLDYIMTYSKGLIYIDKNGQEVNRGEAQIVISGYLLHKDATKAGDLNGKSYYVQDKDDICVDAATDDGKYVTVSYESINGALLSLSAPEENTQQVVAEQ